MSAEIIDARMAFLERSLTARIDRFLATTERVLSEAEAYLASLPSRDNPHDYRPSDCEAQSS